jgi:hypothetical protein
MVRMYLFSMVSRSGCPSRACAVFRDSRFTGKSARMCRNARHEIPASSSSLRPGTPHLPQPSLSSPAFPSGIYLHKFTGFTSLSFFL